jgi:hypothetical protein
MLGGMAFVLLACNAGDSTDSPTLPDLAGAYAGEFTVAASSAVANQNLGPFPATATISQQKSNVSIVVVAPEGGALTFHGTVAAGGAITLDDEADLAFLSGRFPACSFTSVTTTNRALPSQGRLVLTANVSGASCPWHESNGAAIPTTFAVRFEGTP